MTIDTFLEITEERIPTVDEVIDLCDHVGIKFAMADGKPVMRPCEECRDVAVIVATLFRREPFRSAVIARKLSGTEQQPTEPKKEEPDEQEQEVVTVPPGAEVIVSDKDGRLGREMKGPAYTWTYTGASKWWYVSETPIPVTFNG